MLSQNQLHSRVPFERMMYLHTQLQLKTYPNCVRIADHFELDRITILRDIHFMRDRFQLPIEYDNKRHGYYYSRPVENFPGVMVSESELFAILVAQKAVAIYKGTPFHEPLATVFNRLAEHLGKDVVLHMQDLGEAMEIRLAGPELLDEENFLITLRAVQQHRPLKFSYRKVGAIQLEDRKLHPYQLVCTNNRWYVVGHDLARKEVRCFVLTRMINPEILPGEFVRPAEFKIADYLKGSFGIFKGNDDFEIVIELDRWAADISRNRRWHPSQQVTELPNGEMRISFRLDSLGEITPWILSWGSHAVVVRPRILAERVEKAARGILERYDHNQETPLIPPDPEPD